MALNVQYPVVPVLPGATYSPTRLTPVKVVTAAESAADRLDAADGVMDGKYFGMKILAPTQADGFNTGARVTTSYTPSYTPAAPGLAGGYGLGVTASPMTTPYGGMMQAGGVYGSAVTGGIASSPMQASFLNSSMPLGASLPLGSSLPISSMPLGSSLPLGAGQSFGGNLPFSSGLPMSGGLPLSGGLGLSGSSFPLSSASITNGIPPALSSGSYAGAMLGNSYGGLGSTGSYLGPYSSLTGSYTPYPYSSSYGSGLLSSPFTGSGFFNSSSPLLPPGSPVADFPSPVKLHEGNSTINISNTGWEKLLEELKNEVDILKTEGGMAALRELLQMKVEELEKTRQSEMVKEKELHRLQDMYAEEIRKHTEDMARIRKAESDLTSMRQAEAERQRVLQLERERAAAEALAKKTPKKKSKKGKKKSKKGSKKLSPKRTLR